MWTSVVEAVAAGSGSAIAVGALARRWFRAAVRDVVDDATAPLARELHDQGLQLARIEAQVMRRRRLGGAERVAFLVLHAFVVFAFALLLAAEAPSDP